MVGVTLLTIGGALIWVPLGFLILGAACIVVAVAVTMGAVRGHT